MTGTENDVYPQEDDYAETCECEIDWRCGLHAGRPTFLETRFSELDLNPNERSW